MRHSWLTKFGVKCLNQLAYGLMSACVLTTCIPVDRKAAVSTNKEQSVMV